MRVVVTGASGNVGTSVLQALAATREVQEIVGVARRRPQASFARTSFVQADIASDELVPLLRGADAVIHLAWLIQPGRDESVTHAVNVRGSERVFRATVEAGVPALLYASSVGAYSQGPKDRYVDEAWPTEGTPSSFYSRHKATAERQLDRLQREQPQLRVVRMRPGLIFKREAATEIRRLFLGPLLPGSLVRSGLVPLIPDLPRLRFQAVHSLDVGEAFRLAAISEARGAFNLAAEPAIGVRELAEIFHARPVKVPLASVRALAAGSYAMRLQPTEPGWLDMALAVPLMDCTRARTELGWEPRHSATQALQELLGGLRAGGELNTPPLARGTSGPARLRELLTGVGGRA
ncbi:MAG: NAD-dependent epimerase/dehydratase family protein [Actinomycetota bacterium]|nr:NAD-dependent epimerase/dehydratase family protein [Actinomycetota bacterium]